jgi:ABC-2 type transport system permease protein
LIELKKFFSKPKSFVFLVLGPIALTILFGSVYLNDYLNNIPMAILDLDNTEFSRSIVEKFENDSRYSINYYPNNDTELKELFDKRLVSSGLYMPKNFENDMKSKKGTNAALFIDGTNIAIGNNGIATGTEILNTINGGITIKFLEAEDLPPTLATNYAKIFQINSRTLWDPKLSYKSYVMPGLVLVIVQQLFLSVFVINYISDRKNLFGKAIVHIFFGMVAYFSSMLIIKNVFNIHMMGSIFVATIVVGIYLITLLGIAMTIGAFLRDKVKATQFCMMMSMPTFFMAGYIWPIFKMPVLLSGFMKLIWPLIYMVSPLRDFVLKGFFPKNFSITFVEMLIFGLIWFFIGNYFSKKFFKNSEEA